MSEITKTDNQILKAKFDDLNEKEQERFFDLIEEKILEKYGKLVPKGSKTKILVLENGLGCILNHPKPYVLSKALGALSSIKDDPDMYKAGNHILKNCWVAGDNEILDNEELRFAAALQAAQVIEVLQGRLKKN